MNARSLLQELERLGVELHTDGDYLEYEGPEHEITPELLGQLRENKQALIKLLEQERRRREEANRRGLDIKWSKVSGWIKLHDPLTGQWHEVRATECLRLRTPVPRTPLNSVRCPQCVLGERTTHQPWR